MCFNLVENPWIPVLDEGGRATNVSLQDLFREGEAISDLAVNPVQRISLMRLLICITQAALDGPEDERDWLGCRDRIAKSATSYLGKWHDKFDLYGEEPFLQVPGLTCNKGGDKTLGALDFRSPYGGSCTPLFEHEAPNQDNADVALNLLSVLNFSTGGKVGQAIWQGNVCNHSTFAGPCIKATHTFIRGENVLATVHLNLLTKKGAANGVCSLPNASWGRPVWENVPKGPADNEALQNAAETYLGRLVPFSRLVNLSALSNRCIFGPPPKGFRIEHLPAFREPTTTVLVSKKGDPYYLSISSGKHIWRELGAILATRKSDKVKGAVQLNAIEAYSRELDCESIDLWVGGLELGKQAAKLNELVEWNICISPDAIQTTSLQRYEQGVHKADQGATIVRSAIFAYYKELHEQMDKKDIPFASAQTVFWSELDKRYRRLLEVAEDHFQDMDEVWCPIIVDAMENAFAQTCPHTTPRQIQAFAKARLRLTLSKGRT